jgi:hypothetical protein
MNRPEVSECLAALRAGRMSLDEVADRFRRRDWPRARRPGPATYAEVAQQQDVEADVLGSYDEVTAAYDRGDLTSYEYRVLSCAVADAINARIRAAGTDPATAGDVRAERPAPGPDATDGG